MKKSIEVLLICTIYRNYRATGFVYFVNEQNEQAISMRLLKLSFKNVSL